MVGFLPGRSHLQKNSSFSRTPWPAGPSAAIMAHTHSQVPPGGGPRPKEGQLRRAILKRSGVAGVSSVVLAGARRRSGAERQRQRESAQRRGENTRRHLVGPVTALTDCVSHAAHVHDPCLTLAERGTTTGTTTNPAFAIGQRSPDHGVWFRNRAASRHEPRAWPCSCSGRRQISRHLGFQAGSHRLSHDIDVTDPDHFTSDAVSEFFDVAATATGKAARPLSASGSNSAGIESAIQRRTVHCGGVK